MWSAIPDTASCSNTSYYSLSEDKKGFKLVQVLNIPAANLHKKSSIMYDQKLLKDISRQMIASGNTIAVAESVTSGHLQAALSASENAGAFFEGGLTVYNARQKVQQLQVDAVEALQHNSVSKNIATQMAMRCARVFMTSIGIGITGYASAMPFHEDMDLYACYAIVLHDEVLDVGVITSEKKEGPLAVQVFYAEKVLEKLLEKLANICPK